MASEDDTNKTAQATDHAILERSDSDEPQVDAIDEDAQHGVQNIEAVTLTWSKQTLIMVFAK